MGAEYRFNLTEEDFAAFESDIRGKNLDHVLRSVPAFEKAEGSVYYYIAADPEGKWRTVISVDSDGLVVCDYGLALPLESSASESSLSVSLSCGWYGVRDFRLETRER